MFKVELLSFGKCSYHVLLDPSDSFAFSQSPVDINRAFNNHVDGISWWRKHDCDANIGQATQKDEQVLVLGPRSLFLLKNWLLNQVRKSWQKMSKSVGSGNVGREDVEKGIKGSEWGWKKVPWSSSWFQPLYFSQLQCCQSCNPKMWKSSTKTWIPRLSLRVCWRGCSPTSCVYISIMKGWRTRVHSWRHGVTYTCEEWRQKIEQMWRLQTGSMQAEVDIPSVQSTRRLHSNRKTRWTLEDDPRIM